MTNEEKLKEKQEKEKAKKERNALPTLKTH